MTKELYLRKMKGIRKTLRENATNSEKILWQHLRKMQLGFKFRRQVSIGFFVFDFYCKTVNLAIDVDGGIHNKIDVNERDRIRQEIIESDSVVFLRFTNEEINANLDAVLDEIKNKYTELSAPP